MDHDAFGPDRVVGIGIDHPHVSLEQIGFEIGRGDNICKVLQNQWILVEHENLAPVDPIRINRVDESRPQRLAGKAFKTGLKKGSL